MSPLFFVMRKDLQKQIHLRIVSISDDMKQRLPPHPSHPNGRIPIAHCYEVIQSVFGKKCRDIRDHRFNEVMEVVDFCYQHAEDMDISSQLYSKYEKEPEDLPMATLERFFE